MVIFSVYFIVPTVFWRKFDWIFNIEKTKVKLQIVEQLAYPPPVGIFFFFFHWGWSLKLKYNESVLFTLCLLLKWFIPFSDNQSIKQINLGNVIANSVDDGYASCTQIGIHILIYNKLLLVRSWKFIHLGFQIHFNFV